MRKGNGIRVLVVAASLAAGSANAGEVQVQQVVPYADDAIVAGKIKHECSTDAQLAAAVQRFAANGSATVKLVDALDLAAGEALKMEIVDAESAGNAWIGHHKSVTVRGWLYRDGQQVAKFVARRNSSGGFAGGFKGSCSVLERTANAIGKDVAGWLQNPVDGAQLGDLR